MHPLVMMCEKLRQALWMVRRKEEKED